MRFLIVAVFLALGCSVAMGRPSNEKVPDDALENLINLIENIENAAVPKEKLKEKDNGLVGHIKNKVHEVTDFGAGLIKEGANNVEKAVLFAQDKASDVLEGFKDAVDDFKSNVKQGGIEAVENAKNVLNSVRDIVSGL